MRYQNSQTTQRVYDDIRVKKVIATQPEQELLTSDLITEKEYAYLFEVITSKTCEVVFTFSNGKVSFPKTIEPDRVVTFENLRPITSITFKGEIGTELEIAIAVQQERSEKNGRNSRYCS